MSTGRTIDMHCDTLMHTFLKYGKESDVFEKPELSIDVKRLIAGKAMAQFFAVFMVPDDVYEYFHIKPVDEDTYIEGCISVFNNTVARHGDVIAKATTADEIENNFKDGKVSAVLTMEDGIAVHDDMNKLDRFYHQGVRALSLTWNHENCFGFPNSRNPEINEKGLKPFGIEAVKHMQEIGMLVDVSHLNDGGFWDVYKLAKVPFVATHSNCRSVCNHPRNMTDDMIKALSEKGGVMGINFSPDFLDDTKGNTESRVRDMVEMAQHEKEVGGIDGVAIGTDFDGIEGSLEINGCDKMHLLYDALIKAGFTTEEVDKISHKNVLRVMKEAVR